MSFDIDKFSELYRNMYPEADFSTSYTFYYDETNNIKKFEVLPQGFNNPFYNNFVLGGVVFEGEKPDVTDLRQGLRLQSNVNEFKLKHIAKGSFIDCLKSKKLNYFLRYIFNSPLYVHHSSVNVLYFSIVDIVDSAISNNNNLIRLGREFVNQLKSDLYDICKSKIDEIAAIFYEFEYPNVAEEKIPFFNDKIIRLITKHVKDNYHKLEKEYENQWLNMLVEILEESARMYSMPFIVNDKSHVLLDDFFQFYMRPLYVFVNSVHVFDKEADIEKKLSGYTLMKNGAPFTNYRFINSCDDILIQISDVLIGLRGKLATFINTHSFDEIEDIINGLAPQSFDTLKVYVDLMNKSLIKNPGFIHYSDSFTELQKINLIHFLRGHS